MQLTQFTDLSCRILIYLARLPEPGTATINEIADFYQLSRNLKAELREAQQACLAVLGQSTLADASSSKPGCPRRQPNDSLALLTETTS